MRVFLLMICCAAGVQGCTTTGGSSVFGGGYDVAQNYPPGGGYTDNPYDDPFGSPYSLARRAQLQSLPDRPEQPTFRDRMANMFLGSDRKSFGSWFKERITPRMMKEEVFNTPNALNQLGNEEDLDVDEALREVRNGTRKLRMRQRYQGNDYAVNQRQYLNQYDVPVPKGNAYGQGFNDGCKTFMSLVGAGSWRMVSHRRMNPQRLVDNNWYLRGYNDGADFCTSRTDWDMH